MVIALVVLAVVVLAIGSLVATGRLGGGQPREAGSDVPTLDLPPRDLTSDDLDGLRLPTRVVGYDMASVDALVDRLQRQLAVTEGRELPGSDLSGG